MKEIVLTRGYRALVDDEDFEWLTSWSWCALSATYKGEVQNVYACRKEGSRRLYMHREILDAKTGLDVDHINGIGLDNRRSNLRVATRSQNQHNSTRLIGPSGYMGVSYLDPANPKYARYAERPYKAKIQLQGRAVHIGYFATAEDAAMARDVKALELMGEFARLNFPDN